MMNMPSRRELLVEDAEDVVEVVVVDAKLTAEEERPAERLVVEVDATAVKSMTSEVL